MRISIPVNVLAAVLACSAVVSVDGFSVPKSPSASSQSAGAISQISLAQSPRAFLFPGMSNNNIAPTPSSSTALFAKKKAKKTPAAAALEQLEALEALEADLPDPIGNGAPVGVAAAVDEPLSKKEQMALEKQRKKEAKAAKKAAEQAQKAAAANSDGLASSVGFNQTSSMELVNPDANKDRVREANRKWFNENAGFQSALPPKK